MTGPSFRIPKRRVTLEIGEFASSKKWNSFFSEPRTLQSFFVEMQAANGKPIAGVTLQRSFEDESRQVDGTISLGLWVSTEYAGMTEAAIELQRRELVEYIDEGFGRLFGIQAWVAHWNWVPRFDHDESRCNTPYEDAVSTMSIKDRPMDFGEAVWCRANLRGFGDYLWLGESLLSQLDLAALEHVASLSSADEIGRRIQLQHRANAIRLEETLQPILPVRHGARNQFE